MTEKAEDKTAKGWVSKTRRFSKEEVAKMNREQGTSSEVDMYPVRKVDPGIIVKNFVCRVCGSKRYKALHKMHESVPGLIGPGNRISYSVVGYECEGCSASFADPRKFSKEK